MATIKKAKAKAAKKVKTALDWQDGEAIDKAIKSFQTRWNKANFKQEIHELLVACALHAVHNNGADKLTNLWNALDNSINKRNGVGKWIAAFTSYELRKDKAGTLKFLAKTDAKGNKMHTFVEEGVNVPFWMVDGVDKANSKPFSLVEALTGLIKKADKKAETDFDKSLLATLHSVVDGLKATTKAA